MWDIKTSSTYTIPPRLTVVGEKLLTACLKIKGFDPEASPFPTTLTVTMVIPFGPSPVVHVMVVSVAVTTVQGRVPVKTILFSGVVPSNPVPCNVRVTPGDPIKN